MSVEQYKALWGSKTEMLRREAVRELLCIYRHEWDELLEDAIKKLFSEEGYEKLRKRKDVSVNPLRWVVTERSKIYSRPPVRSIESLEPLSE